MIANIIRNARKIVTGGDPYYSAVSLLLPMDGTNGSTTFTDSSLNGLTVNAVGNTQISTTQSKYGGASGYFDGSGDYLSIPTTSAFGFGTSDYTAECWIYIAGGQGTDRIIFDFRPSPSSVASLFISTANKLTLWNGTAIGGTGTALNLNQWYHVALCRSAGVTRCYLNGVQEWSSSVAMDFTSSRALGIGSWPGNGLAGFFGYIDDLRISLFARYASNFTPPASALPTTASSTVADPYYGYTSLLLHMDGSSGSTNFVDSGPNAFTLTRYGTAAVSTTQSKYGAASGYFDGSGARLGLSSTAIDFGTGDFTAECWIYLNATPPSANAHIMGKHVYGTGASWILQINTSRVLSFLWNDGANILSTGTALNLSQWYHIAASRSGSTIRIFINGTQVASTTISYTFSSTTEFTVCSASNDNALSRVNAFIDDLRITKYARYTSAFAPPAQAHPNIYNPYTTLPVSGAALWLDASQQNTIFSDAGTTPVTTSGQSVYQWNDLSGNNRHAIQATSGNRPTWDPPASGQNGLGAIRFNGSSQWLDIASFPSLSTGYTFYAVIKQASADGQVFCTANAGTFNSIAALYAESTTNTLSVTQWGAKLAQTVTTGAVVGFIGTYDGSHPTGNFLVRTSSNSSNTTGTMSQNAGTPASGTAAVGRATNASYYLNSQLYELVVLPRQSTTAEDTSWKSYSASKWGITWS